MAFAHWKKLSLLRNGTERRIVLARALLTGAVLAALALVACPEFLTSPGRYRLLPYVAGGLFALCVACSVAFLIADGRKPWLALLIGPLAACAFLAFAYPLFIFVACYGLHDCS